MAGSYTFNGRSANITLSATTVAGSAFGAVKSWQLTVSRSMVDVTSFDSSGWTERYPGMGTWEFTCQTLALATGATQEQDTLRSALSSETRKYLFVKNSTAASGSQTYRGWGYVSGWDLSGDESSPQIHNFTFTGDGKLNES
jgi:predicted secreted protein